MFMPFSTLTRKELFTFVTNNASVTELEDSTLELDFATLELDFAKLELDFGALLELDFTELLDTSAGSVT